MTFVKVNHPIARNMESWMNEFFQDMPNAFTKNWGSDSLNYPPVNTIETTNAFQLELVAPGLQKADFQLKLDGNLLTIHVEKTTNTESEQPKYIRREFQQRSFKRSFTLTNKIDTAQIQANYQDGILRVTLPKKEEAIPSTREITIQ